MTIKEFEEKARIGTTVSFRGKQYIITDRDLRTHEAVLGKFRRARCSEIELVETTKRQTR